MSVLCRRWAWDSLLQSIAFEVESGRRLEVAINEMLLKAPQIDSDLNRITDTL